MNPKLKQALTALDAALQELERIHAPERHAIANGKDHNGMGRRGCKTCAAIRKANKMFGGHGK
jgi:hypothetical protein